MAVLFVYILPFLAFTGLFTIIALRIHWRGGPAALLIVFFGITFGPSLIYAIIADESSGALFGLSLVTALIVIFLLWLKFYRMKK
jgi:hypothetical protein